MPYWMGVIEHRCTSTVPCMAAQVSYAGTYGLAYSHATCEDSRNTAEYVIVSEGAHTV